MFGLWTSIRLYSYIYILCKFHKIDFAPLCYTTALTVCERVHDGCIHPFQHIQPRVPLIVLIIHETMTGLEYYCTWSEILPTYACFVIMNRKKPKYIEMKCRYRKKKLKISHSYSTQRVGFEFSLQSQKWKVLVHPSSCIYILSKKPNYA